MNPLPRTREAQFREPRLLDSRTPGVSFQMTGSARWTPRRTSHPDIAAVVRDTVVRRARTIAAERYADDIRSAEDAINADLRASRDERTPYYSRLTAAVTLRLSEQDMASSLEYRRSLARLVKLRFLKKELYSDPSMLLLDYLDRHPEKLGQHRTLPASSDSPSISNCERWWCRVLDTLYKLSSDVPDEDGNLWVMNAFAALQKAAPAIFSRPHDERAANHQRSSPRMTTVGAHADRS